jgi:hypothetical protein
VIAGNGVVKNVAGSNPLVVGLGGKREEMEPLEVGKTGGGMIEE